MTPQEMSGINSLKDINGTVNILLTVLSLFEKHRHNMLLMRHSDHI